MPGSFGGTPYQHTLYPKLSFDSLHETLHLMGTMTGTGRTVAQPAASSLPTLCPRYPLGLPANLEEDMVRHGSQHPIVSL